MTVDSAPALSRTAYSESRSAPIPVSASDSGDMRPDDVRL